ncbi:MAG: CehA/McbA family metallohydrolase [Phycisphaerae bacterium]|nr:CehA/McbA family metallohydrolase [Phycisphaerae bacterium]
MAKFVPVDLSRVYNTTLDNRPPRGNKRKPWSPLVEDALKDLPRGRGRFWGIPFKLGAESPRAKAMTLLPAGREDEIRIPLGKRARYLCFAHACDSPKIPTSEHLGQTLAEYVIEYADGQTHAQPIRARFEINGLGVPWGGDAFAAVRAAMPRRLEDTKLQEWGQAQCGIHFDGPAYPWIYAMKNPRPDETIAAVILRSTGMLTVGVLGLTLYSGTAHPLRHLPRRDYRLVLPSGEKVLPEALDVSIDLGSVIQLYALPGINEAKWLAAVDAGLGGKPPEAKPTNQFFVEAEGAPDATLSVRAGKKPKRDLSLGQAFETGSATSDDKKVRIELVYPHKTWVHVSVTDSATSRPVPTRAHFRGKHGEYLPPYGHPAEINDKWFEDVGGDLKLGEMSYAYVPGRFQTELPVGEVYVELSKGFEYRPLRKKIEIKPGQHELHLQIERWTDLSKEGWRTADTHVHFLSPQTAHLEAQCEGLNLLNLLASQWGRLFTNVGDLSGELNGASTDETLVWVGTENRHHILGHISMLGTRGDPVFPMCGGGPDEADVGDANYMTLAEWSDLCRQREGLVVLPHFPFPLMENAADLVLGKIDAVELRDFMGLVAARGLDTFAVREWYRYLNCGYRVAAVGGTDKMSAGMPVGGVRTYARIDANEPLTFGNWARAIRSGHTFTTSGPLIDLTVDGHPVGSEIRIGNGGATLECQATVRSAHPVHCLELVVNGQVVAREADKKGAPSLSLHKHVELAGSAWIAARALSKHTVWHCWPIHLAAHTSPVYVVGDGRELFSPSDATYMLTLIDGGLTWADTLSVRYDAERHAKLKAVFQQAKMHLEDRMHVHDHDHEHGHHYGHDHR